MFKTISAGAFAALLALAAGSPAQAFSRQGSVSGPRGTATLHAEGGCSAGTCTRSITRTGPDGATLSRSGTASCADGHCTGSRTTTGPRGHSVTRSGTFQRY